MADSLELEDQQQTKKRKLTEVAEESALSGSIVEQSAKESLREVSG